MAYSMYAVGHEPKRAPQRARFPHPTVPHLYRLFLPLEEISRATKGFKLLGCYKEQEKG
jgi:hypothetical protein